MGACNWQHLLDNPGNWSSRIKQGENANGGKKIGHLEIGEIRKGECERDECEIRRICERRRKYPE